MDGLRALAVLPVILFHARLGCPGGFVGVDVFFVISGYLISSLILKEIAAGDFSLPAFWERRIRRIFPALLAMVLAVVVAGWFMFLPADFALLGKSVVAQTTLLSNVFFFRQGLVGDGYFAPASDVKPLLHTWSLAVEEQFYLFFPLLLIYLSRRPRISLTAALAWLAAISFGLSVAGSYGYPPATFYLLPTRAWELLLGALLVRWRDRGAASAAVRGASGWLGLGLIGMTIFCYHRDTRFPGLAALPPCLGAALIIYSGEQGLLLPGRMLACRPLVFIGLISYSLYLWHWPALVFAKYWLQAEPGAAFRGSLLLASLGLAALSWKYVELPFRRRRVFAQRSRLFGMAGSFTAGILMLGVISLWCQGMPARFSSKALYCIRSLKPAVYSEEDHSLDLAAARAGRFVELGETNASQPVKVLIWGDSQAMAITPVIADLCHRFSCRGLEAAHYSTAPALGYVSTSKLSLRADSPAFAGAVCAFIATNHVQNVIMAAHWVAYATNAAFASNWLHTVRALVNSGTKLYVLKNVPVQNRELARLIKVAAIHNGRGRLEECGVSPGEYEQYNQALTETFAQISQSGATVLDPTGCFLNRQGLYGVVKDDQVLYVDYLHLSVDGARLLAPLFEPIFEPGH